MNTHKYEIASDQKREAFAKALIQRIPLELPQYQIEVVGDNRIKVKINEDILSFLLTVEKERGKDRVVEGYYFVLVYEGMNGNSSTTPMQSKMVGDDTREIIFLSEEEIWNGPEDDRKLSRCLRRLSSFFSSRYVAHHLHVIAELKKA
jgi:hypothetical protein